MAAASIHDTGHKLRSSALVTRGFIKGLKGSSEKRSKEAIHQVLQKRAAQKAKLMEGNGPARNFNTRPAIPSEIWLLIFKAGLQGMDGKATRRSVQLIGFVGENFVKFLTKKVRVQEMEPPVCATCEGAVQWG